MKISKEQFLKAASKLGLAALDKKALWEALEEESSKNSSMPKLLYYFGAMIVISAQTWFMNLGWAKFGGGGLFLISVLYAAISGITGAKLWKKEAFKTPAGLLITMAVCMTPLAIYGIETFFELSTRAYPSFYSIIKIEWIWMDIGTILAGLVALKFYPFPFLTAPIFFAAWFLSMDIVPLFFGQEISWSQREWVSLGFGIVLLLISYVIDLKKSPQYGFWGYLFGTLTFWVALDFLCYGEGEAVLFSFLLINLLMMVLSIFLQRKMLMIFGSLGALAYFSHLAHVVFENSILFPFALTFLGLVVIYGGVLYQKNRVKIEKKMLNSIPKKFQKFLPLET